MVGKVTWRFSVDGVEFFYSRVPFLPLQWKVDRDHHSRYEDRGGFQTVLLFRELLRDRVELEIRMRMP